MDFNLVRIGVVMPGVMPHFRVGVTFIMRSGFDFIAGPEQN
jgi:hypothetical protein